MDRGRRAVRKRRRRRRRRLPRQVRGGRQLRGAPAGLEWQPSVLQDYGRPRHQHRVWRAADDAAGGGDDGRRVVGLAQGSRPGGSALGKPEPPDEPAPPEAPTTPVAEPDPVAEEPEEPVLSPSPPSPPPCFRGEMGPGVVCPDDDDDPSDANDSNDAGRCRDCRAATAAAVAAAAITTASQRRLLFGTLPGTSAQPHAPAALARAHPLAAFSLQQIRVRKPAQFADAPFVLSESRSMTYSAGRGGRRRSATRSAA